jgi:predicted nucleic acid-binding protein
MKKVFIDSTGWFALIQPTDLNHDRAKDFFQNILDSGGKLYTNIIELNSAVTLIKKNCGLQTASEFSKIIEEAVLSTNLHISWLSRRLRRNSLKHFFSFKMPEIEMKHCIIFEEVRKRKINYLFSFDPIFKSMGIPLMPLL